MVNRRNLVLVFASLLAPLSARPQQAGRPYRIGLVPDYPPGSPMLRLLSDTLAEFGRVEGHDYVYIRSGIYYGPDTQRALASVLEAKPDLLFIMNLGYAVAAHKITKTLPVVMWVSGFPVEGGVAESLARPGKNVTGMTIYTGGEFFGKLVQLVHEARPSAKRIGALMSYVPPFHPRAEADIISRGMRDAAQPLGVDVRIYEISKPEDVDDALASVVRQGVDALVLTSDASMVPRMKDILRFAAERRLPTIVDSVWRELGDPQPLLEYRSHFGALMRQAAPYVDKVLWQGVKPGDLPIQLPARFVFAVHLKTAKAIGIAVPQSILLRADEVIQ